MDNISADGRGTARGPALGQEAARTLAEIRARCIEASERAKEAMQRAEAALATAQDRLRRAQALQDTIRANRTP